jgi:hypothetical protein
MVSLAVSVVNSGAREGVEPNRNEKCVRPEGQARMVMTSLRRCTYPPNETFAQKVDLIWNQPVSTGNAGASPAMSAKREKVTASRSLSLPVRRTPCGRGRPSCHTTFWARPPNDDRIPFLFV